MTEGKGRTNKELRSHFSQRIEELLAKSKPQQLPPLNPIDNEKVKNLQADRELRDKYANRWFWVVLIQLLVVNIFFGYLLQKGNLDSTTLQVFFGATIAETFGIVAIITRSLFPKK